MEVRCSRCGAIILVKFVEGEVVFYTQPSLSQLRGMDDERLRIHPSPQVDIRPQLSKNEEMEKE